MNPIQPCTPVVFTWFYSFRSVCQSLAVLSRFHENSGKGFSVENHFDRKAIRSTMFRRAKISRFGFSSNLSGISLNLVKLVPGVVFIGIQMFGYWSYSFHFFPPYGTQKKKIEIDRSRDIKREKFNTKIGNRLIDSNIARGARFRCKEAIIVLLLI